MIQPDDQGRFDVIGLELETNPSLLRHPIRYEEVPDFFLEHRGPCRKVLMTLMMKYQYLDYAILGQRPGILSVATL